MIQLLGFSAWITCPDGEIVEYDTMVNTQGDVMYCWIPSEIDKPFSVHWRDHGGGIDTATYIKLDGETAPGQFLMGEGEAERSAIRVAENAERPFLFSEVKGVAVSIPFYNLIVLNVVAEPKQQDSSQPQERLPREAEVGTIVVKIKRVKRMQRRAANKPLIPPSEVRGRPGQPCITYGPPRPIAGHHSSTWDIQPYDPEKAGSFVKFVFRYRSKGELPISPPLLHGLILCTSEFLISQGIMRRGAPLYRPLSPPRVLIPAHYASPPTTPSVYSTPSPAFSVSKLRPEADVAGSQRVAGGRSVSNPVMRVQGPITAENFPPCQIRRFSATLIVRDETQNVIDRHQRRGLPTYSSTSAQRLKALYSDFSLQKQSNPTSYSSYVEWWRRTLEAVVLKGCLHHGDENLTKPERLVLHANGSTLADDFRFEGVGKPLGLPTVIVRETFGSRIQSELCETKSYFRLSDFLTSSKSIYDPGWLPYRVASYVVGKPLWWALQQLSIVSPDDTLGHSNYTERWKKVKGDYVVISLLERAADSVIARQRERSGYNLADSLYNFDGFRKAFADHALEGVVLSDLDLRVLIRYLQRDKKVLAVQKDMIKFVETDESPSFEFSAVDIGILELKSAVENLQGQVDSLQSKISERLELISAALRHKRKEVAMSHLRARKQLEDLLGKRLNSLDTLQSTLLRVEASAGDVEIMKSYESSTATLRAILAHPSLQREKIDETMDAMASANADAKETDDAIRMGMEMAQADAGIDEAELEDELKALLAESERETAEKARHEEELKVKQRLADSTIRVPSSIPAVEIADKTTAPVERDDAVAE
ncbi:hypothetical protein POSPLADRAFT_1135526 [Postia placenta MAD-698-R-SB12]|uniref:DUF7918 domain-containing protein n=1 Tax=Postia placenta MAD-698-R-SB12 TaxID=670580 RepID=A0A1X6N9L8_9APHY|nr:hypothetical protein POSPLADRAFT_1135526 [Postia placenta MAD-698-R-SB12]OSX65335.1 hypothetical protein POSPLADRAFT_1135526 [Postia placenta MAD-698-R-SB12]